MSWPGKGARGSYATYFIPPLVITAMMLLLAPVGLGGWPTYWILITCSDPPGKFVLAAAAVPACFAVGYALTQLPGLSTVL